MAYPITSACKGACFYSLGALQPKTGDIFFLRGPLDASWGLWLWINSLCYLWYPTWLLILLRLCVLKNTAVASASVSFDALLMCSYKVKVSLKICFLGKCFLGALLRPSRAEASSLYGGLMTTYNTCSKVPFDGYLRAGHN